MTKDMKTWWKVLSSLGRLRALPWWWKGPAQGCFTALLGAALVLSACGPDGEPVTVSPEATPVNGDTVAASPSTAPATPTPAPTPEPTPTPEVLSDEEIAARVDEIVQLVNEVADAYPASEFLSTIKVDAQTALAYYDNVIETKDYKSILTPLNGLGNIGHTIYEFACFTTEGKGEPEAQAWAAIKDLVLDVSHKYEDLGFLEEGMTQSFNTVFFTVAESCTNPAISNN